MGWETGLIAFAIIAIVLTISWLSIKCATKCFKKIDLVPLMMWFKMFSFITGGTFIGLLILYCFIGV